MAQPNVAIIGRKPSDVEAQKEHWIRDIKSFCPWSAQIVSELNEPRVETASSPLPQGAESVGISCNGVRAGSMPSVSGNFGRRPSAVNPVGVTCIAQGLPQVTPTRFGGVVLAMGDYKPATPNGVWAKRKRHGGGMQFFAKMQHPTPTLSDWCEAGLRPEELWPYITPERRAPVVAVGCNSVMARRCGGGESGWWRSGPWYQRTGAAPCRPRGLGWRSVEWWRNPATTCASRC